MKARSSTTDRIYNQTTFYLLQIYYLVCGFWILLLCVFKGLHWFIRVQPMEARLWSHCTACNMSGSVLQSRGLVSQTMLLICWLTRAWVGDISCPSLIRLPHVAVFESDTGKLAKDQGHSRSTLLWCGRAQGLFLLGLMSWGQGQQWEGLLEYPGCQVVTYSHIATSGKFVWQRVIQKGFKEFLGWNPAILPSSFLFLVQAVNITKSVMSEWVILCGDIAIFVNIHVLFFSGSSWTNPKTWTDLNRMWFSLNLLNGCHLVAAFSWSSWPQVWSWAWSTRATNVKPAIPPFTETN